MRLAGYIQKDHKVVRFTACSTRNPKIGKFRPWILKIDICLNRPIVAKYCIIQAGTDAVTVRTNVSGDNMQETCLEFQFSFSSSLSSLCYYQQFRHRNAIFNRLIQDKGQLRCIAEVNVWPAYGCRPRALSRGWLFRPIIAKHTDILAVQIRRYLPL